MHSLTTQSVRPAINAHRTRRVADAVVSAYLREISSPAPAAERPVIRALGAREVVEPPAARVCERPRIRIRRWAPPERRGPALEAAA